MVRILIHLALIFLRLMPLFILYTALYRDPGHQALKKAGFTKFGLVRMCLLNSFSLMVFP